MPQEDALNKCRLKIERCKTCGYSEFKESTIIFSSRNRIDVRFLNFIKNLKFLKMCVKYLLDLIDIEFDRNRILYKRKKLFEIAN